MKRSFALLVLTGAVAASGSCAWRSGDLKMWEASGLPYTELIDRLFTLALERHAEKQQLRTSIT